jgi:hypothetical protein
VKLVVDYLKTILAMADGKKERKKERKKKKRGKKRKEKEVRLTSLQTNT